MSDIKVTEIKLAKYIGQNGIWGIESHDGKISIRTSDPTATKKIFDEIKNISKPFDVNLIKHSKPTI